jgi:uncharacterized protein YegL
MPDNTDTPAAQPTPDVHLYILLDRSGSMAAMADDVIGGFNRLLAEQQANGNDARITLVQFDSGDPQEVVADAVPIAEMTPLDAATFVPRGSTPLLDATAMMLDRAAKRVAQRKAEGLPAEELLIVSITDGHENASTRFTLTAVRQLVEAYTAAGWTFVFLGAAVDVYAEAGGLGYDVRSVQSFAADGTGTEAAWRSLSRSTSTKRDLVRRSVAHDNAEFFVDKDAEEHRRRRLGN